MPNDVFISYSHKDNVRVAVSNGKDPDNWVDWFHVRFAQFLTQLLRREARIWRDRKLKNDDELTDEIRTNLQDSKFLVPIVSPSFTSSSWCPDEVQIFLDHLAKNGLAGEAAAYIHPVCKLPVATDELAETLTGKLGIAFYHQEETTGRIHQWDPSDREMAALFNRALYALCHDISDVLSKRGPNANGPRVFMPLSDRVGQIPRVRTELKNLGYLVSDNSLLKHIANQDAFVRALEQELDQSQIVIMLPGLRSYLSGSLPVERLQWEAIRPRLQQGRLKCLVWTDDKRSVLDPTQEEWIEALGAERGGVLELLKCSFQQFLSDLGTMLLRYKDAPVVRDDSKTLLVVDYQDSDTGHPLLDGFLTAVADAKRLKVEVIQQGSLSNAEYREKKSRLTQQAHAMVLFSARSTASWLKARYEEAIKVRPEMPTRLFYALAPDGAEDKKTIFLPAHENFILADNSAEIDQMLASILKEGSK